MNDSKNCACGVIYPPPSPISKCREQQDSQGLVVLCLAQAQYRGRHGLHRPRITAYVNSQGRLSLSASGLHRPPGQTAAERLESSMVALGWSLRNGWSPHNPQTTTSVTVPSALNSTCASYSCLSLPRGFVQRARTCTVRNTCNSDSLRHHGQRSESSSRSLPK